MTEASKKTDPKAQEGSELLGVPYIHYPVQFIEFPVEALINSASDVNVMQPSFAKNLGLRICKVNVGT